MSDLLHYAGLCGLLAFAYLMGAIPFGYLFAKRVKGKDFDIRDWGSGNIGFTNVKGVLGSKVGIPVLIFDILKGFIPVLVARLFVGEPLAIACLIASAIGHSYSIYFYWREGVFSGGKAVATIFGGILAIHFLLALIILGVWYAVLRKTDYMSVASIVASICAAPVAFLLSLGNWTWVYAFVALFIIYRHARNIGRLMHHNEPKFSEERGAHHVGNEAVIAFAIHPRDEDDLLQSPLSSWITKLLKKGVISKRMVRWIVRYGKIIECGETPAITGYGEKYRAMFLAVPLMPDQAILNPELTRAFLKRAAVIAQRRGARVLGLGGLLSTIFKGIPDEEKLDVWAKNRGLTIKCDNGAAFTVAATLIALEKTLVEKGLNPNDLTVAIIGARGAIGYPVYDILRNNNNFGQLIPVLRDKRSKSEDKAIVLENVIQTDERDMLSTADIIISCTSSPKPIFDITNHETIKKGAIFLDVAFPPDFDRAILEVRNDITLIACGLILLPGEFTLPIDIHFDSVFVNGEEKPLIPACLAETILTGITERYEFATLGIGKKESVEFFAKESLKHGFEVIVSSKTEQDIYAGIKR